MKLADLNRLIDPLRRRLRDLVLRGVVHDSDDGPKMRTLQVGTRARTTLNDVEHFEPYGFSSRPLDGAEHVAVQVGAAPGHTVVLVVADRRYRIRGLEKGEVALADDQGLSIVLRRGGRIEVTAPTLRLVGNLEVEGNVTATGDVADGTASMQAGRETYNIHTHGGVETGSGTSGVPLQPQ